MTYEKTRNEPSGWWRWPLLPFAAYLGALLGALALALLQWFGMKLRGGFNTDGWYFIYVIPVMSAAVFGWLYVLITLNVAPKGKVVAAIVMTTILGVISLLAGIFMWLYSTEGLSYSIQATISSIATMVTAIASIAGYKDEYDR